MTSLGAAGRIIGQDGPALPDALQHGIAQETTAFWLIWHIPD